MNTGDEWKTTATVTNPERGGFWKRVFGGDRVPILMSDVSVSSTDQALVMGMIL